MKHAITLLTAAAVITLGAAAPASAGDAKADGKTVFTQLKCNSCHSVEKQGIKVVEEEGDEAEDADEASKPTDLSTAGDKRSAAWIKDWLNKKVDVEGKKHRKKFEGTPAQLDVLATWLASLKS